MKCKLSLIAVALVCALAFTTAQAQDLPTSGIIIRVSRDQVGRSGTVL